jgi:hypothetical protein
MKDLKEVRNITGWDVTITQKGIHLSQRYDIKKICSNYLGETYSLTTLPLSTNTKVDKFREGEGVLADKKN